MSATIAPSGYNKRANDFSGPPGPGSGAGSSGGVTLNIEDEGEPVPRSPTNTINFIGGAVRVYYDGSTKRVIVSVASRFNEDGSPAAPGEGTGFLHSELDGLRWKLSGHTAAALRIAGFDMDGEAKEYPQAKHTPAPHAVAMTGGDGRIQYAIVPSPALEYNVIGLGLMLG